jgi:hypothetical protein
MRSTSFGAQVLHEVTAPTEPARSRPCLDAFELLKVIGKGSFGKVLLVSFFFHRVNSFCLVQLLYRFGGEIQDTSML